MKKDLPNVYANPINKNFNNVQNLYYGDSSFRKEISVSVESILKKINNIFSSNRHVYKSRVKILTGEGVLIKDIVGKTRGGLLTLDGELIKIIDIIDIEKI